MYIILCVCVTAGLSKLPSLTLYSVFCGYHGNIKFLFKQIVLFYLHVFRITAYHLEIIDGQIAEKTTLSSPQNGDSARFSDKHHFDKFLLKDAMPVRSELLTSYILTIFRAQTKQFRPYPLWFQLDSSMQHLAS